MFEDDPPPPFKHPSHDGTSDLLRQLPVGQFVVIYKPNVSPLLSWLKFNEGLRFTARRAGPNIWRVWRLPPKPIDLVVAENHAKRRARRPRS